MILDIIVIVFFVLMIIYGYTKGCISIVAKLVSVIIAFVLAYFLADAVGGYIESTKVGIQVKANIEEFVLNEMNHLENTTVITLIQEKLNILKTEDVAIKVIEYVFVGIGFIVVFVLARIVLWIAQKILESIFELPVLKTFNKLGGVIASVILFLVEISVILAIITSLSTIPFASGVVDIIKSSVITKVLYEHNILANLILTKIM